MRQQPVDDGMHRHAVGSVNLGIEGHLDVVHAVAVGSFEIREGEIGEVGLRAQDGHTGVVEVEK